MGELNLLYHVVWSQIPKTQISKGEIKAPIYLQKKNKKADDEQKDLLERISGGTWRTRKPRMADKHNAQILDKLGPRPNARWSPYAPLKYRFSWSAHKGSSAQAKKMIIGTSMDYREYEATNKNCYHLYVLYLWFLTIAVPIKLELIKLSDQNSHVWTFNHWSLKCFIKPSHEW